MKDVALILCRCKAASEERMQQLSSLLTKHGIETVCGGRSLGKPFLAIKNADADMAGKVLGDYAGSCNAEGDCMPVFVGDLSMITVVGHGLDNIEGLRDNLEKSLADNDIDMVAVNHSANDNEDFSEFFVPASGSADALKCLHSCCF